MHDPRPVIVVPKTAHVARMLEPEALSINPRAQRNGIVVIVPRHTKPADLMVACYYWPRLLAHTGVARVAIVLGIEAYADAEPILGACARRMKEQGVSAAYFHEGQLESDEIHAWFQRRDARKRTTSQALVALGERYACRGNSRAAMFAMRMAGDITSCAEDLTAVTAQPCR